METHISGTSDADPPTSVHLMVSEAGKNQSAPMQETAPASQQFGGARVALGSLEPCASEEDDFVAAPLSLGERAAVAAALLGLRLLWAWHLPLIIAEERGHRRTRQIGWLVWLSPLVPPLWPAALLWALLGRSPDRGIPLAGPPR
ncbi:MAG TPA: hypothetical protein VH253_20935 [Phycisphaerae bacterium]|nr:hypothetical protein [Phycisphaerae bacterium]